MDFSQASTPLDRDASSSSSSATSTAEEKEFFVTLEYVDQEFHEFHTMDREKVYVLKSLRDSQFLITIVQLWHCTLLNTSSATWNSSMYPLFFSLHCHFRSFLGVWWKIKIKIKPHSLERIESELSGSYDVAPRRRPRVTPSELVDARDPKFKRVTCRFLVESQVRVVFLKGFLLLITFHIHFSFIHSFIRSHGLSAARTCCTWLSAICKLKASRHRCWRFATRRIWNSTSMSRAQHESSESRKRFWVRVQVKWNFQNQKWNWLHNFLRIYFPTFFLDISESAFRSLLLVFRRWLGWSREALHAANVQKLSCTAVCCVQATILGADWQGWISKGLNSRELFSIIFLIFCVFFCICVRCSTIILVLKSSSMRIVFSAGLRSLDQAIEAVGDSEAKRSRIQRFVLSAFVSLHHRIAGVSRLGRCGRLQVCFRQRRPLLSLRLFEWRPMRPTTSVVKH